MYETVRTRKSTNASTFVDNRNIINSGLPNTLYAEGKIAAIEQLNQEAAKADVETAAHNAMNKYASTVISNFLKSWNETVSELYSLRSTMFGHTEVSDTYLKANADREAGTGKLLTESETGTPRSDMAHSYTLPDGATMSLQSVLMQSQHTPMYYNPTEITMTDGNTSSTPPTEIWIHVPDRSVSYLNSADWSAVLNDLETAVTDVQSGLTTWVNNVYDQVQAGAIEVSELITPRERAKMIAADDGAAQAIADLAALNIPVDAGNKYKITMADTGATLRGTLAVTDDSQTIESGSTYDPSANTFSGDAFFTYNVATGSGDWSAYEESIDGGVATFTEAPYEKTQYELTTSKNETVTVSRGNFTAVDSSGNPVEPHNSSVAAWEVDLSDQLENDIANVNEVDFFADVNESRMETIKLDSQFTVEKIENAESGEEVESASFEKADPQTDNNYITQSEWEQLQEQNRELIEKYEESQNTGGGGIDLGGLDMFGLPGEIVALVGAGAAALLYGNSK
ncbi:hypothetical protein [Halolamina pelagica]|uniref:hypothetical protein n=1 Tax=Halolamina pelagica TaxID=699431 RepID=UPI001EFAC1E7|nr:hypothetical protein [Halolamina pelagica]